MKTKAMTVKQLRNYAADETLESVKRELLMLSDEVERGFTDAETIKKLENYRANTWIDAFICDYADSLEKETK
jgi:hypothetical protein